MRGRFLERSALPPPLVPDPLLPTTARRLTVPINAPTVLPNRVSMRVFNAWYYRRDAKSSRTCLIDFDRFFFPLDRLQKWNRMYGRRGLVQYQCVLPKGESSTGIRALLDRISSARSASFLTVLKLFGPVGEGLLSFPMAGYTLTLDFPMQNGVPTLLAALDEITHRHGGRVYLAKDACCTSERVRQGYPRCAAFDTIQTEAAGPVPKIVPALSWRLAL